MLCRCSYPGTQFNLREMKTFRQHILRFFLYTCPLHLHIRIIGVVPEPASEAFRGCPDQPVIGMTADRQRTYDVRLGRQVLRQLCPEVIDQGCFMRMDRSEQLSLASIQWGTVLGRPAVDTIWHGQMLPGSTELATSRSVFPPAPGNRIAGDAPTIMQVLRKRRGRARRWITRTNRPNCDLLTRVRLLPDQSSA